MRRMTFGTGLGLILVLSGTVAAQATRLPELAETEGPISGVFNGGAKPRPGEAHRIQFVLVRDLIAESAPPPPAEPPAPDDDTGDLPGDPAPPAQERLNRPPIVLDRSNLDRWIFGNMTTELLREQWLEQTLEDRLFVIGLIRPLTPAEAAKLRLAGRGDIRRLFERIEAERPRFDEVRGNLQAAIRFLHDDLWLVSQGFRGGPFGKDSLLAKTLAKLEDDRRPSPRP